MNFVIINFSLQNIIFWLEAFSIALREKYFVLSSWD